MAKDPRGPIRTITEVNPQEGATLCTLSCGHIGYFAQHFTYKVGADTHCFTCRDNPPKYKIFCEETGAVAYESSLAKAYKRRTEMAASVGLPSSGIGIERNYG